MKFAFLKVESYDMKHCDESKIWDYIDGQMDEEMRNAFLKHLEQCPDCCAELQLNQSLHQNLERVPCLKKKLSKSCHTEEMDMSTYFKPKLHYLWKPMKQFLGILFVSVLLGVGLYFLFDVPVWFVLLLISVVSLGSSFFLIRQIPQS